MDLNEIASLELTADIVVGIKTTMKRNLEHICRNEKEADMAISLLETMKETFKQEKLEKEIKDTFNTLVHNEFKDVENDNIYLSSIREMSKNKIDDLFFNIKNGHLVLPRQVGATTYISLFAQSLLKTNKKVCVIGSYYNVCFEGGFDTLKDKAILYQANFNFNGVDFSKYDYVLIDNHKGYDFYNTIKTAVKQQNKDVNVISLFSGLEILD